MSGWFYRTDDGSKHGPLDNTQIIQLAESGELAMDTPVLHDKTTKGRITKTEVCGDQPSLSPTAKRLPPEVIPINRSVTDHYITSITKCN